MTTALVLWVAVLGLAAAGCRGDKPASGGGTPPAAIGGAQRVRFAVPDGSTLDGWLYGGRSAKGIVLVPDAGRGYEVWGDSAQEISARGQLVLALDFSAVGGTAAGNFNGAVAVQAAAAYLRTRGAERVVLVGEGAGGAAALAAAGERVSGVAVLSTPALVRGALGEIDAAAAAARFDGPQLFVGALGDAEQATAARRLYDAAPEPRTLALVPGTARGADILRGPDAAQVREVLSEFLREAFADRSA